MKKNILLFSILIALFGCEKDPKLAPLPIIITNDVSNISYTTATMSFYVYYLSAVEEAGIVWDTNSTISSSSNYVESLAGEESYTVNLSSLPSETTIYYKAYAKDGMGNYVYGEINSFITKNIILPVITTSDLSDITWSTAICGGVITLGSFSIKERGVCYNTSGSPTINNYKITAGTGSGTYTSKLTGLTPNTTYYVRAYAIDTYGNCIYGAVKSFSTTNIILPIVTTSDLSDILEFAATCGGTIILGSVSIKERGVCYNTLGNPTINNYKITTGIGSGTYFSKLTDLTPSTTYYVRAYAIDSYDNCVYGAIKSFTTIQLETGTFIDTRDNLTYKWVKIGNQIWMAENLKATKYNNGTAISNVTVNATWNGLSTGAYCYYNNDAATYGVKYGCLYNWYAVKTGKLAPTGWHVPTDAEWTTLSNYLGGKSVAGGKMRSTTGWSGTNTGATNSSCFTALPGGNRSYGFYGESYRCFWWSSSMDNTYTYCAYGRDLSGDSNDLYQVSYDKYYGFSVRCVRDN